MQTVQTKLTSQGQVSVPAAVYPQARADVASTTTAIAQDRNALELLVGSPVDETSLPTELPPTANWLAEVPAGVSSDVLLRRPDVSQAEHRGR